MRRQSGVGYNSYLRGNDLTRPILDCSRALLAMVVCSVLLHDCMPATRVTTPTRQSESARESSEVLQGAQMDQQNSAAQRSLLMAAEIWVGTPYRYGGSSSEGIDCSAFVQSVFAKVGVNLPRTSREQSETGTSVSRAAIQTGDLLFFNTSGNGVSHVGIAIGAAQFVHASTSRGVIVSSLEEEYYDSRLLFCRRVL